MAKQWIQQMHLKKGTLTKQANKAHMGVQAFAHEHASDPGVTGKRSRLAITFAGLKRHNPKMLQTRHK